MPRASGDDPIEKVRVGPAAAVCPARAGMIPRTIWTRLIIRSMPRASGDDPAHGYTLSELAKYAPRERG